MQLSCTLRNLLIFSFYALQPHFRHPLFETFEFTWSMQWCTFGDGFHYFLYTLKKVSFFTLLGFISLFIELIWQGQNLFCSIFLRSNNSGRDQEILTSIMTKKKTNQLCMVFHCIRTTQSFKIIYLTQIQLMMSSSSDGASLI